MRFYCLLVVQQGPKLHFLEIYLGKALTPYESEVRTEGFEFYLHLQLKAMKANRCHTYAHPVAV